ncbi:TetR family transcriptional regulator [Nesterenkonia ebinurensis]|uniref:TetR family transcriptional regulator n=1 Tax=Nesterenkonia ebinurensis TaxID=2608252 RepID=UPI00123D3941
MPRRPCPPQDRAGEAAEREGEEDALVPQDVDQDEDGDEHGPASGRYEVAQAVWRVILRSGLARASVRAVAQEAGLSVGSLRHYFSEQRELQIYALELINERAHQRYIAVDRSLPVRERIESSDVGRAAGDPRAGQGRSGVARLPERVRHRSRTR